MQELIKKLMDIDKQGGDALMWMYHNEITLLEKEKEVIEKAYNDGYLHSPFKSSLQYFGETFKTKEK